MQARQLADGRAGFVPGQDVGALLGRGGCRPAQDFALLLCPGQADLGKFYQQISLKGSRPAARHDDTDDPARSAPLFDPQLVPMTSSQMTLHGYQIHAEAGTAVHYAQCWALRQVADPNS